MKTYKIFALISILALLMAAMPIMSVGAAGSVTLSKGNVALSGGSQSGSFPETWDLTADDLTISFTYDGNGLVDDFGGSAHAWTEIGIRDNTTLSNFNPNNKGVWLATDYEWAANGLDPDVTPTQDIDDKLMLQKVSGNGEGVYDLPSPPPSPGSNHRFWFDRDGVDQWQAQNPLAVDGGTYNTGGLYNVVMTLHATGSTTGEAYMTINGLGQGFETDGNWKTIELTPAGMTFTGDMAKMQVFYGIYGYGAAHSASFQNIIVTGFPADTTGPVTSNVVANPNPVAVGGSVNISAQVDDSTTGGKNIASANYEILDNNDDLVGSGSMSAIDSFDSSTEGVTETITAPSTAGIYDLCVYGTDVAGNAGEPQCIMFVVYDPSGGFVTGGGWIDSPAGAFVQDGPVYISGDTSLISFMGYTGYMYRNLDVVCDPNNTPVTFSGALDVSGLQENGADLFGLVDKAWVDAGNHGYQTGAYLYVGRRGNNLIVGPSDGNAGGELVQAFKTFTDYYNNGTLSPLLVSVEIYNGTVTVSVAGTDLVDDYGTVVATAGWAEFESGAYIGVDSWPSTSSSIYNLTFDGCSMAPVGRATFGFVSKYKKGASIPEGNTEFQFKAGDLNFHSTSYEWLVVTGSDYARFKGEGTINGGFDSSGNPYKFMIWAGDDAPDTFRIKIWYEENGSEIVVYDNGMDQPIGGGSIVVHTK